MKFCPFDKKKTFFVYFINKKIKKTFCVYCFSKKYKVKKEDWIKERIQPVHHGPTINVFVVIG